MVQTTFNYNYTLLSSSHRPTKCSQSHQPVFRSRRRYLVGVLAFFGFFNIYALRVNLSVAVVAMSDPIRIPLENGTVIYKPEFDWSPQTKGLLLSSFFYGYILTQLPGSWLAARIGGNRVFGIGIGVTSLLTVFTPAVAHSSTTLLVVIRVIEGLFEGVTYPSIHAVWSRWAPSDERTRLATLAFSGSYMGNFISMPLSSLLARYAGWSAIFFIFGVVGIIWTTVWLIIVKESPEDDPHITSEELTYIQKSRGTSMNACLIHRPWRAMLTSPPVWAIVAAHFSENWGFYTLLTFLPTFIRDVHKFEMTETGLVSALPYLAMTVVLLSAGHIADYLLTSNILTITHIRKLFTCGAFLSQTVFMMAAAYSTTATWCILNLTVAVGLGGFAWSGFSVNHLDIAPTHASTLMALSNTVATLPGVISPTLAGAIVTDNMADQWRIVFSISSAIYFIGATVYAVFCSAETQPWALESTDVNETTGMKLDINS